MFDILKRNIFDHFNITKRNCIFFCAKLNHKSLNDRQCKWQTDNKTTSLTQYTLTFNITTKTFNLCLNDIKTILNHEKRMKATHGGKK